MGRSNICANFWLRKICREVNSLLGKFSYRLRLVVRLEILKDERNLTFVHMFTFPSNSTSGNIWLLVLSTRIFDLEKACVSVLLKP